MLNVTLTRESKKLSLRLEGHAGYAEHGRDIVCASASILAYTVARLILEMNANGRLFEPPIVRLCVGDSVIEAKGKDQDATQEAMQIMHFAEAGYALLQNTYPEHIKFVINEV